MAPSEGALSPARTLILSGGGRFSDPWHPFELTSDELAQTASSLGLSVEISEDLEKRAADLSDVSILIVNATDAPPTGDREAAHRGIRRFLKDGGRILAMHVGGSTLLGLPEWNAVTGMRWVDGRSSHMPVGEARVAAHPERHVIARDLGEFDLVDECYVDLELAPDLVPFVTHDLNGRTYPLAWARTYGKSTVVVDALGHGVESYRSPEHRRLLMQAIEWLSPPSQVGPTEEVAE